MYLVGIHIKQMVHIKAPLPARKITELLPLAWTKSCSAMRGPVMPIREPRNEARPVAVPLTAAGNASGVHPNSCPNVRLKLE